MIGHGMKFKLRLTIPIPQNFKTNAEHEAVKYVANNSVMINLLCFWYCNL